MPTTHVPDLDLAALRMLTQIADLGSISAAARAQQISQPSASKRIQVLEHQLRLELLDRRTRGATLTAHGQLVTDWCRTVIDAVDLLQTGAGALAADAGAQLKLAASQTVAEYLVPGWLGEFRAGGHRPPVRLRVANSTEVIAAVRSRDVDLGFVETPSVPSDLGRRTVATDELLLVASRHHPVARGRRPLSAADLAALPLATREAGSGTRETLRHALGRPMAPPGIELNSNAAVKVLVSSGDYPAVLSELVVAGELRDGRFVAIPVTGVNLQRSLRAIWRRNATPRGAAADFLTMTS